MCIAILKPKDKTISKEILETCSKNNPDGMGFACIQDNKVYMYKFMDFDDFYDEYIKHENNSTMIIHFRIATHGKVEVKNCHPFKLNHRMALIHNGVISGYGDKELKTDTQDFIEKVIGNISWKEWKNPSFRQLVGNAIGYSKFCILDVSGNYYIINENKGSWDNGVWYSNSSYKPKEVKTYTTYSYKKDNKEWDMYGNETYDSWYSRTHNNEQQKLPLGKIEEFDNDDKFDDDYAFIYRCKCGNVYKDTKYDGSKCSKCGSNNVEEVGCYYNGTSYYYEQESVGA